MKVIRWHTRVPVTDPERVTDELVAALHAPGATTWVAVHANHPREFSPEARSAIARLVDGGDRRWSASRCCSKASTTMSKRWPALMRAFVENRIKPYYLHHPDLAPGTSHFRLSIDEGLALMRAAARAAVRPGDADLYARYAGRLRQGAAGIAQCGKDR